MGIAPHDHTSPDDHVTTTRRADRTRSWAEPSSWSAIVVGGATGSGAVLCRRLHELGVAVVCLDREASIEVDSAALDLTDTDLATEAAQRAVDHLGRVDVLICGSGDDDHHPTWSVEPAQRDRSVAAQLLGAVAVTRAALPHLEASRGRIVNLAPAPAPQRDAVARAAAALGMAGFTRSLTRELEDRVEVTLLTPTARPSSLPSRRPPAGLAERATADPSHLADTVVWCLMRPAPLELGELAVRPPSTCDGWTPSGTVDLRSPDSGRS